MVVDTLTIKPFSSNVRRMPHFDVSTLWPVKTIILWGLNTFKDITEPIFQFYYPTNIVLYYSGGWGLIDLLKTMFHQLDFGKLYIFLLLNT